MTKNGKKNINEAVKSMQNFGESIKKQTEIIAKATDYAFSDIKWEQILKDHKLEEQRETNDWLYGIAKITEDRNKIGGKMDKWTLFIALIATVELILLIFMFFR